MAYVLMPALVSPPVAEIYKNFLPKGAPRMLADIQSRAEQVKQNPGASPPALPPASATFGRGGTSFFA
jgi:hypothetical protein